MGFKDCEKVLPVSTFVSLPDDNDMAEMMFVGEPIPREEQYRSQTRYRYYFPVITKDGLQVWGVGAKIYRHLRDSWQRFLRKAFTVTRHGTAGSQGTTYDFASIKTPAVISKHLRTEDDKTIAAFLDAVKKFGEVDTEASEIPI